VRVDPLKNVPTLAESGLPEFELSSNLGAVVRAATPKAKVNHPSAELQRAIQLPDVKDALPQSMTPVALRL
jgi:tripartite-type tricarboxylate transporter receptor subunit TctC